MRESLLRFIRQQGFAAQRADEQLDSALMLQPRVIGLRLVSRGSRHSGAGFH